jgi:putative DNA primase/helicase
LVTGGDTFTARFMRQNFFTFTPTHQLWLMGNSRPNVKAGEDAFWRRVREITFRHTVPKKEQVDDLQQILAGQHGPAVLAWITEGAVAYGKQGLGPEPQAVKVATADYAREQDTVAQFLEERCRLGGGEQVQLRIAFLRGAYEAFYGEIGASPVSATAFGAAMK